MRSFLIQLSVTVLVLAAGFVLALLGAVLFGIGLGLWALLVLASIKVLDLLHGSARARSLQSALRLEPRRQTFQAQKAAYTRLGVNTRFRMYQRRGRVHQETARPTRRAAIKAG